MARALIDLDPRYDSRRRSVRTLRNSGDLDYFDQSGKGPGAAMRVSPIGVVRTTGELPALVQDVLKVSTLTHGAPAAIESAVAVAAAVSSTVEGDRADAVVAFVLEAVAAASDRIANSDGRVRETIRERYARTCEVDGDARLLVRVLGRRIMSKPQWLRSGRARDCVGNLLAGRSQGRAQRNESGRRRRYQGLHRRRGCGRGSADQRAEKLGRSGRRTQWIEPECPGNGAGSLARHYRGHGLHRLARGSRSLRLQVRRVAGALRRRVPRRPGDRCGSDSAVAGVPGRS